MDKDLKSGLGYIIPVGSIVGYVLALVTENFNVAMIMAACGILLWFIYLLIMEIKPPQPFGNIIVFFGVLLSFSVFLSTGLEQDIFGGYLLQTDGLIYAILVLFFTIMAGVLFRSLNQKQDQTVESQLSQSDKELVEKAIAKNGGDAAQSDPRIIVVKQEAPAKEEEKPDSEEPAQQPYPYPYPYPQEYYEESDEDEEYEDDDEEYEDDEYEDYEYDEDDEEEDK